MRRPELDGVGVLVTRPAHQASGLCALIEQSGGRALRFPVMAIAPVADPRAALALVGRLAQYNLAIFISPNAVEFGFDLIEKTARMPAGLKLAAVGEGSARALFQRAGRAPDLQPQERFDSESLLALPELQQVSGWRIAIFRGEGGRELLAETLRARGAEVDYIEVYRRERPLVDRAALALQLRRGEVNVVTVTSSEGLRNLLELAGDENSAQLRRLPLVVVSERTAELARSFGFSQPVLVAAKAGDAALVEVVARWARERARDPGEGR